MARALSTLAAALCAGFVATASLAQDTAAPATLVSDRVDIQRSGVLVASGNVEVLFDGTRLQAQSITYDRANDRLIIAGPITLTEDSGSTVILADQASLSTDLQNGILTSARLVLNEQLQIAATEINRVDGRYTQAYQTVASTCRICEGRAPLWQIRAKRIIHDTEERQLYFDNMRFEVAGLPILWLPRLRLPDPTLKRATGFLPLQVRSTDALGFGIKVPYFIVLGPHKDLTVTPYISANDSRTLELRYRQAFRHGRIEFNGAFTQDDIIPEDTRSYLFGEGSFDLPRDFKLEFDIETTSDDGYLLDYGYSDKDRLDSAISLTQTRRDTLFEAGLIHYYSLRSSEDNRTQPTLVGDIRYTRLFQPSFIGGTGALTLEAHHHRRASSDSVDGPDPDSIADGRDVTRIRASVDWQRTWTLDRGLLLETAARLDLDATNVGQDPAYPDAVNRATPQAAVTLRWPLIKANARATHILEPQVQLVWAEDIGDDVPNDESTLLELDEGNLFSFSRFPGADQIERGLRANVGLTWTRIDRRGWELSFTAGRILREDDLGQFAGYPGIEGKNSDWLLATQLRLPNRLSLTNRALFDDDFGLSKNELRLAYAAPTFGLGASYIWMEESPLENRANQVSELTLDTAWQINDRWAAALDWRYDFEVDRAASAELGLEYQNECIKMDLSVSRRFTSSTSIEPTTDFGFSLALVGFGAGDSTPARRRGCYQGLNG